MTLIERYKSLDLKAKIIIYNKTKVYLLSVYSSMTYAMITLILQVSLYWYIVYYVCTYNLVYRKI